MGDGLTVTVTGAREFEAELRHAVTAITPGAVRLVKRGAVNVKRDWRRGWNDIKHAPRLPYSIDFDIEEGDGFVEAEIGAQDGPVNQGFLAPIIAFGGIHNAPNPADQRALDLEEPRFAAEAEKLSEELLP
jgi:hypothetical protein